MDVLPVASGRPHMLESERSQQLLEIAKRDRRARISEKAFIELVDAGHGCLEKSAAPYESHFSGKPT
jgi:hypothetical protein